MYYRLYHKLVFDLPGLDAEYRWARRIRMCKRITLFMNTTLSHEHFSRTVQSARTDVLRMGRNDEALPSRKSSCVTSSWHGRSTSFANRSQGASNHPTGWLTPIQYSLESGQGSIPRVICAVEFSDIAVSYRMASRQETAVRRIATSWLCSITRSKR